MITNTTILILYIICALFVSIIDWECSEHSEDVKEWPKYLVLNLVVWWLTIITLSITLIRNIKRETRRKK